MIRIIAILGMVAMLVVGGVTVPPVSAISTSEYCQESVESDFLTLLNQHRASLGVAPVTSDQILGTAAEHHTIAEYQANALFHNFPDGTSFGDNIRNHGWPANSGGLGEITGGSYQTAAGAFGQFTNSPDHEAVMVDSLYQSVGISRWDDGGITATRYWWVVEFSGLTVQQLVTICPTPTATNTSVPTNTPTPANTPTPKPCPTKNPHYPSC